MCGISGYISKKKLINDSAIKQTLHLMKRRGPDNLGFFKKNIFNKEIGLLHSRLKIIDINKRSNQPYSEKDFTLIFNGEIYNYIEIREKLKKKNHKFKTNSDTEVLLKSFIEYGENCVDHFIGMWAFAIWDNKKKKLFISRDIFGEKPLFYFFNQDGFFFGSEIKEIKSLCNSNFEINKKQIYRNLFNGYKSLHKTNETFYNQVYNLENSSNITIDLNFNIKKQIFWKPKLNINHKIKKQDAIEGIKHYLLKSLNLRMRSDVPIAFCLSGGIDSSLLASIATKEFSKNISTFSIIESDKRYNEEGNIDLITKDLKCKNKKIFLQKSQNNFFNRLKELTLYHDSPIATISYYIHSFLSEAISKNNYKVSISGTGADEIFTGYYDHYLLHLESVKNNKLFKNKLHDWKKYVKPDIRNPALKDPLIYINNRKNRDNVYEKKFRLEQFSTQKKNDYFSEINYCNELLRNRMLNELFNEVVPVILKHDDLNSMYFSVENRSPYLDKELLSYSLTIPPEMLIDRGYQKKLLRDVAQKFLTEKVRLDRKKIGFNASISSLIDFNNKSTLKKIFNKKSAVNEYIDLEKLKKEINFNNIPNHFSKLIFSIISTNYFLEN